MTFTSILQLHKNGKEQKDLFDGFFPFSTSIYLFVCLFDLGEFFEELGYFGFPGERNIFTRQNFAPLCESTKFGVEGFLGFTHQEKKMP